MKPISHIRPPRAIIARTRFFDEQVLSAVSAGVKQIVICGAGYDDRGLRFRAPGVRFFELDHPATQEEKARRLREIGVDAGELTLIPADFRYDDPAELLGSSGHSLYRPTLFVCEGLLAYLDQGTVLRLLGRLRLTADSRSTLAASLAVLREGRTQGRAVASANRRRRLGWAEPWLTILPMGAYSSIFSLAGWRMDGTAEAGEDSGGIHLITTQPTRTPQRI